jgi:hypothetical protein
MPRRSDYASRLDWLDAMRWWYAGLIMAGYVTDPDIGLSVASIAGCAMQGADSLIAELDKPRVKATVPTPARGDLNVDLADG